MVRWIAVGLLAVALTACGGDTSVRDDDGAVVNAGTWSVFDLRVGDCLAPEPDLTGEISDVPVVPCTEPHSQEVFGAVEHPDGAYPGAAALATWADGACLGELATSLGLGLEDGLYVSYLLPTFDGWNLGGEEGDRRVVCVLVTPDATGVTGSHVAGTATLARGEPVLPSDDDATDDATADATADADDTQADDTTAADDATADGSSDGSDGGSEDAEGGR